MFPNKMESNPIQAGKDEIREHLVQAACQVFMRYGYKKTVLDDIAPGKLFII